jgi:hypothetical protein
MVRTQIQLTEEQAVLLKHLAAAQGVSMAEIIRRAVDSLDRSPRGYLLRERRERAAAVAGRFHSGVTDLATDHDRYLIESIRT